VGVQKGDPSGERLVPVVVGAFRQLHATQPDEVGLDAAAQALPVMVSVAIGAVLPAGHSMLFILAAGWELAGEWSP
jgi:hypothetical protein